MLLIASGADPVDVQAAIRHARLRTTLETYVHSWPKQNRRLNSRLCSGRRSGIRLGEPIGPWFVPDLCQTIMTSRFRKSSNSWVELWGFEPQTPSMRTRCATRLRHSPLAPQDRSKANRSPPTSANRIPAVPATGKAQAEYDEPRPPASYGRPRRPPPRR
jgi:hypothetical protein